MKGNGSYDQKGGVIELEEIILYTSAGHCVMCYITRGNVAKVYSLTAYSFRMGQITFPIPSQNWGMKVCIIINKRLQKRTVGRYPLYARYLLRTKHLSRADIIQEPDTFQRPNICHTPDIINRNKKYLRVPQKTFLVLHIYLEKRIFRIELRHQVRSKICGR